MIRIDRLGTLQVCDRAADFENAIVGRYGLAPPSVAASKVDGSLKPYQFANRPAQIITVESLNQVYWLNLERASLHLPFRAYPRKAQRLLKGEDWQRYGTRSEAEHAIVTVLVNGGYSFEEILVAFRSNPAAGKFSHVCSTEAPGPCPHFRTFCEGTLPQIPLR